VNLIHSAFTLPPSKQHYPALVHLGEGEGCTRSWWSTTTLWDNPLVYTETYNNYEKIEKP